MSVTLTIPGPPTGKGRPRFRIAGKGERQFVQVYTPAETQKAEAQIRDLWEAAGGTRLPDGPVYMTLEMVMRRPDSHWNSKGELNAAGRRSHWPLKKPDVDNVEKLVCDSLNGCAFKDDAHIVRKNTIKRWANPGEQEHTKVSLRAMWPAEVSSVTRQVA